MKIIVLNIILLYGLVLNAYAQSLPNCPGGIVTYSSDFIIYACNGIGLLAKSATCDFTHSPAEIALLKSGILDFYGNVANPINAWDFIANPTPTYNCHSYAWYQTEVLPMDRVWLEYPAFCFPSEVNSFSTATCYTEVDNFMQAEKLFYFKGGHSAVMADSGKVISKWGAHFLIKHHPKTCDPEYLCCS